MINTPTIKLNSKPSEKIKKQLNKYFPIVLSCLGAIFSFYFLNRNRNFIFSSEVLGAILTYEGILIGFLIASQSILASIDNKDIIRWHKEAGTYKKITVNFLTAINWSFASALLTIIALFIKRNPLEISQILYFCFWIFSVLMSNLLSYRLARSFSRILQF